MTEQRKGGRAGNSTIGSIPTAEGGGTPPRRLYLFYAASSLAAGLGLLMPFVALALVLAYGFGHVHGGLRIFSGFMAVTGAGIAVHLACGVVLTLRLGRLKVSGAVVRRSEAPRRFWTWTAVEAVRAAIYVAMAVFFASVALQASP
jgi:hypothetical protein